MDSAAQRFFSECIDTLRSRREIAGHARAPKFYLKPASRAVALSGRGARPILQGQVSSSATLAKLQARSRGPEQVSEYM